MVGDIPHVLMTFSVFLVTFCKRTEKNRAFILRVNRRKRKRMLSVRPLLWYH